jgi:hypothetical protein
MQRHSFPLKKRGYAHFDPSASFSFETGINAVRSIAFAKRLLHSTRKKKPF